MRKIFIVAALFAVLAFTGCSSINRSESPVNRSLLLDTGFKLGLDIPIIPIPLPKIDLNFHLHYRRPTPREEMELNLSKLGRQFDEHNQVPKGKLEYIAPSPFRVDGKEKE